MILSARAQAYLSSFAVNFATIFSFISSHLQPLIFLFLLTIHGLLFFTFPLAQSSSSATAGIVRLFPRPAA